ncbi:hypothetical protein Tco_0251590 [Tanacetum coccineum]
MVVAMTSNSEAELQVDCYYDAGFETDRDDIKSLTLNNIAASEAKMEDVWMFCDNSAALLIANESGVQMGFRHYHRSNLLKVYTGDNLAYLLRRLYLKESLLNMLGAWDFI